MHISFTRRKIADMFINVLLALNLLVAFLMTDRELQAAYGQAFNIFVNVSIVVFIVEIMVRMWMSSRSGSYLHFFKSKGEWHHWNCFDFTVTFLAAISLISGLGAFVGSRLLRLLRLFTTMRMFSRHRRMQNVSEAIIKSVPAIMGTGIYFIMLYSIYAIAGTNLYADIDPVHFGNVGRTFLMLFQLMTLDDWSEVMYPIIDRDSTAWLYFFSFILMASYVLLNLIVGVIVDSLQQVRKRREIEARSSGLQAEIEQMKVQLREFQLALEEWERRQDPHAQADGTAAEKQKTAPVKPAERGARKRRRRR